MDNAARYYLVMPTGREGPYTLEDLRALVTAGRARSDDHVQDRVGMGMTTVLALVPEAAHAEAKARVRRKTSDRLVAQGAEPRPRIRTPLPIAAAGAPAPLPAAPATAADPVASRRRRRLVLIALLLLPLAAAGAWFGAPAMRGAGGPPKVAPLDPAGTWHVAQVPGHGGPWILIVAGDALTIAGPGGTSTVSVRTVASGMWSATYALPAPHPVFGSQVEVMVQAGQDWVLCAAGGLRAEHTGR